MITERVVLFEDGVEGNGDVYPLGISRQKWRNDFMVTFATREQLSPFDDIQNFRREERLWIVCYPNNHKSHNMLICYSVFKSVLLFTNRDQV